ncbi:MAG: DMT family transporter, partial [Firmicutes bacterium]|nr:DMT family transporter [Bacillota bacterium]
GLALTGIAFLTLHDGRLAIGLGEGICLLAAVFYAATIVATDRLAKRDDALVLGVLQVGFIGVFGTVSAFIFEQSALPATGAEWGAVLFLAVVCTVLGFTLQPVAQKYTSTEKAGLFCALNPLIAAVLGCVFLQEAFTRSSLIGAALILGSIVISALLEQHSPFRGKHHRRQLAGSGCS